MKKRGSIISIAGLVMMFVSFAIAQSVIPNADPTRSGEMLVPAIFEGMFDYTSDKTEIFPGQSYVFSFTATKNDVPLLWGFQNTNYQDGDKLTIKISNIFGDDFGTFVKIEPISFELFLVQKSDTYNFEVENNGDHPVSIIMMFSEDPDNSPAMTDPNSTFRNTVIPLAASGVLLMLGIIAIVIGIILGIFDWKRGSRQARYY
jgi:hypothetical protein